jgi:alkanesulfonate monooxygenase SsuD/methylene tetrahydromethanopterin reductase-like flavin-dependent oxidoreductase (luciferase family)
MPSNMLRYDMRQPDFCTASKADMYQAALAQCAWGENNGFPSVHISEHHGSEDGYLPAPLIFASAVASRTQSLMMYISALIAPLHDPVQLVEDLTVLDIISQGRVIPILSAGYREEEFAAVGKTLADRRDYMENIGPFLNRAWSGETFDFEGRTVTITPAPHSQPRPPILMGGSSRAAARRAAAHADFFIPTSPRIFEMYREELQKLGKPDPGPMPEAPSTVTFVADDPDQYWDAIAPHVQHETNTYARWAQKAGTDSPYHHFDNTDELRDSGAYRVYRPQELIDAAGKMISSQPIMFHPLCGGINPDLAWESLRLWADAVLPAMKEEGLT